MTVIHDLYPFQPTLSVIPCHKAFHHFDDHVGPLVRQCCGYIYSEIPLITKMRKTSSNSYCRTPTLCECVAHWTDALRHFGRMSPIIVTVPRTATDHFNH